MKSNDPEDPKLFSIGTSVSDSKTWIFSLIRQMREYIREWRNPTPRPEITAAPVEVGEIWSKNRNHIPGLLSLLAHVSVVAIALTLSVASVMKPKPAVDTSVLINPFPLSLPRFSSQTGGGGGGMRAPTPASRGVLPQAAAFQLVPPTPMIVNMNPELMAVPTIIDVVLPTVTNRSVILQMGDPNAVSGPPSGGPGTNNGIGGGTNGGVGDKNGPYGPGPGNGPGGQGPPVVSIGAGGATPPSCPIPATEPNYTDDARKGRVQGTVSLDVVVNRDGTVTVNRIAQKLGYGLDDEASRFVSKNFRCKPGTYQGQAVATAVRIDVNFHLY
jgi:TonB family protein